MDLAAARIDSLEERVAIPEKCDDRQKSRLPCGELWLNKAKVLCCAMYGHSGKNNEWLNDLLNVHVFFLTFHPTILERESYPNWLARSLSSHPPSGETPPRNRVLICCCCCGFAHIWDRMTEWGVSYADGIWLDQDRIPHVLRLHVNWIPCVSWENIIYWMDFPGYCVWSDRIGYHIILDSMLIAYIIWLVVWNIFLFFHILGTSRSQLTNSIIFQSGRLKPATRFLLTIINHIITININH